jgi:transposase
LPAPGYDVTARTIQDLPVWGRRTTLVVGWPRVSCERCGILQVRYGWVGPTSRRTRRYERWIYELTRWIPVADVAEVTGLAWYTVKEIERRYIVGALRGRDLDGITVLGFDEVSYRKGHRYLTIISDIKRKRVIAVEKGRDSAALKRFFSRFGKERLAQVREAVIDMHEPYQQAITEAMPQATIVYDRFHLVKLLNRAIDDLRRRIQRELPAEDRKILKNKRYVLLKPQKELTPRQRVALEELKRVNEPLSTAHLLKEDFRELYQEPGATEARAAFADWIRRVRAAAIPELLDFVKTLRRHFGGVLAFFRYGHRLTNALSEGFNNVIKTIKKVAYGFRDLTYFRLKILRHCGKLTPHALPTGF